jgi:dethiobiotin synthetase
MSRSSRPHRLIVVAGTGTEVGKTWVAAHLAEELAARRITVSARKPAQSFDEADAHTDADVLAAATGEIPEDVCPKHRWYPTPMAPPMAADSLGREPIFLGELLAEVRDGWPGRAPDVGLVELAGGLRSPLGHDGDGVDLALGLAPDLVVLVADAGLGTLNAVRHVVADLAGHPTVVLLNRYDPAIELHRRNLEWLVERDGVDALVDVDSLVGVVMDQLPTYCTGCGRAAADCPGGCSPELDPPRYCPRCSRRLAVTIVPTGVQARCRDHGPIDDWT